MDVLVFTDAKAFIDPVQPVIARHTAEYSVMGTLLASARGGAPFVDDAWFLITDGSDPIGAAMHIPPYNVMVGSFDGDAEEAAKVLTGALQRAGRAPGGFTGPLTEVRALAAEWHAHTGLPGRVTISERLYELRGAPVMPDVPGRARPATEADFDLMVSFVRAFGAEAHVDEEAEDPVVVVRRRLTRGTFVLWEDASGQPVSLAGLSVPVNEVSRIGPVFTPKEHRRHGYGGAVTAMAAQWGFEQGEGPIVLYTDLSNPTSNKIYQEIGFVPVSDAEMISFRPVT